MTIFDCLKWWLVIILDFFSLHICVAKTFNSWIKIAHPNHCVPVLSRYFSCLLNLTSGVEAVLLWRFKSPKSIITATKLDKIRWSNILCANESLVDLMPLSISFSSILHMCLKMAVQKDKTSSFYLHGYRNRALVRHFIEKSERHPFSLDIWYISCMLATCN